MRELRRTRTPGRIVKRNYALRLRCAGCQRFLFGDVGRYRHPAPTCDPFSPGRLTRVGAKRRATTARRGHSYPQDWYEAAVGLLLAEVGSVDDAPSPRSSAATTIGRRGSMSAALARLGREREEASQACRSRATDGLAGEMAHLDAEERAAREPTETSATHPIRGRRLPAFAAIALGGLGARRKPGTGGRALRPPDVLGFERIEYELTPDAIELGLDAALPAIFELEGKIVGLVGARGFEPPTSSSRTMRATKLRHAPTEMPV